MSGTRRSSSIRPNNAGCLFWLAVIVVVLVLFVLNWGKIQETLAKTNFLDIVKTQKGTDTQGPAPESPSAAPGASTPLPTLPSAKPGDGSADPADAPAAQVPAAQVPAAQGAPSAKPGPTQAPTATNVPTTTQAPTSAPASQRTRTTPLYFVRIDDDGVIVRQEVKRQMPVTDSPLTDALGALLAGPNEDELRRKLVSLVPQGTKLLSAKVRGSTAFLNFNEAFMYNHYGIEGYAGQLKQIVYTATSFPTVQDVQFLIEGEKRDYLGEGIYIGAPLSKNSF
jgi:spore germination protein GerM